MLNCICISGVPVRSQASCNDRRAAGRSLAVLTMTEGRLSLLDDASGVCDPAEHRQSHDAAPLLGRVIIEKADGHTLVTRVVPELSNEQGAAITGAADQRLPRA